jgi:5-methylcytosine-specific restriction endonuclease McrA
VSRRGEHIGERFGRLLIVGKTIESGRLKWLVKCDCGNDGKPTEYNNLTSGKVKSCGCYRSETSRASGPARRAKRTGKVQGNYRVLGIGERPSSHLVECIHCGTKRDIDRSTLAASARGSNQPDCCRPKLFKELGFTSALHKRIDTVYRSGAEGRSLSYELSPATVEKLISANCTYCGIAPSATIRHSRKDAAGMLYNGIDRVDNSLGYTEENCVTCCGTCNYAKNTLSASDFQTWIDRLVAFQTSKQTPASPAVVSPILPIEGEPCDSCAKQTNPTSIAS